MVDVAVPADARPRTNARADSRASSAAASRAAAHVPLVAERVIQRERLTASLEQAIDRPVTLIAAPAGAGKTTLIADWARRHPGAARVAWITLSAEEATVQGFWSALSAALGKAALRGPLPDSPEE